MQNLQKTKDNPLNSFMRQPKLYVRLPSNGEYWPNNSLVKSETGEYPVYSMTAKDELILKVPDALLNGQGIVSVIEHCMPNIKNAWSIPNIDLDVILIAIRIATYGEKMKLPFKVMDREFEYELDLRYIIDNLIGTITWNPAIQISPEMIVYVKPLDYKVMAATSTKTFETQRLLQTANNDNLSEDEKSKIFNESFNKLNEITVGIVNNSVFQIDTSEGSIDNLLYIRDFMDNADKGIYDKIKNHIESLREINSVKSLKIEPTQEMIDLGYKEPIIEIPLVFDPSTFFA